MNIGQQPRVYPAVYSGVGVYECMIRGIAVMRRRVDSYVNATQILKVAGIDKGRRTKILEKEILPGKHEIVQGGYGKYQGTWIPLERGRDVAAQYGVAALLAPLFDHVPPNAMMGALPHQLGHPMRLPGNMPPMPFPNMRPPPYMIHYMTPNMIPGRPPMFAPGGPMYPPYQQMPGGPPGSQPRLQMYAPQPLPPGAQQMHPQAMMNQAIPANVNSPTPSSSSPGQASSGPHSESHPSLKRIREEEEPEPILSQDTDVTMVNGPEDDVFTNPAVTEGPPPSKKARTDGGPTNGLTMVININGIAHTPSPVATIDPKRLLTAFPPTTILPTSMEPSEDEMVPRSSNMPLTNRIETRDAIQRSNKRAGLYGAILEDIPEIVVRLLLEQSDEPMLAASDIDAIIDDKGHTALHVAAALGKLAVVEALVSRGADVHRGNYHGETALMRAVLTRENYEAQTFEDLLTLLRQSIRTTDEFKKSVLHHIAHAAGLDRVAEANYYLLTILLWIGKHQGGESDTFINLQDINGDTALNIASRLGMNSLVDSLITSGADPSSANKFGMTPFDYGVIDGPNGTTQNEELDDIPMIPITITPMYPRSTDDVLHDMMNLVTTMSQEISVEKAAKDVEYDALRIKMREVSKQLAANRKELDRLRPQASEYDLVELRIGNLEGQKNSPDPIAWTGRTQEKIISPAFRRRKQSLSQPLQEATIEKAIKAASDSSSPEANSQDSLILLRRMKLWHERMQIQLTQKKESIEHNAEKELKLRKFLSLCTGLSESDVEEQALSLLESAQTETQEPGSQRLAAFMEKVKQRMALIVS